MMIVRCYNHLLNAGRHAKHLLQLAFKPLDNITKQRLPVLFYQEKPRLRGWTLSNFPYIPQQVTGKSTVPTLNLCLWARLCPVQTLAPIWAKRTASRIKAQRISRRCRGKRTWAEEEEECESWERALKFICGWMAWSSQLISLDFFNHTP